MHPKRDSISSLVHPVKLIALIVGLYLFGSITIQAFVGYLAKEGTYWALGLLFLIMLPIALFFLRALFLIPFKTVLNETYLITYGLRGRREIRLSDITSAMPVLLFPTNIGPNILCLKIIDAKKASVIIQLGTIPNDKMRLMTSYLNSFLKKQIDQNNDIRALWSRWMR